MGPFMIKTALIGYARNLLKSLKGTLKMEKNGKSGKITQTYSYNNSYGDNSYQATTHIRRQLISIWKSDNSHQATTHINQNSYQKFYSK